MIKEESPKACWNTYVSSFYFLDDVHHAIIFVTLFDYGDGIHHFAWQNGPIYLCESGSSYKPRK